MGHQTTSYQAKAFYERHQEQWGEILGPLRRIMLSEGLEEKVKWGMPTYEYEGKNIVGVGAFKSYAGLWFFNGAAMNDPAEVLVNAQPGKTQNMRQWRFKGLQDLNEDLVRKYVQEAVSLERELSNQ